MDLEITQPMLANPLAGFCLDYLRGAMLLSHKPEVRDEYTRTAVAEHLMSTVGVVPSVRQAVDKGGEMMRTLKDAMPVRYWKEAQNLKQFRDGTAGIVAGIVYRQAIEEFMARGDFSLDSIKTSTLEIMRASKIKVRHARLDKILSQHRRVAHLWASFTRNWQVEGDWTAFPCRPDQLNDFLYRARFYQEWGMRIRPRGNPPLFSPDELWRVPDELELLTDKPYLEGGGRGPFALPSAYPQDQLAAALR